jgi:hypothetical protein
MIGPGPMADENAFEVDCEGACERGALALCVVRRVAVFLRAVLFTLVAVDVFSRTGGLLE